MTLFDRRNTMATPTLYGEALLTRAATILVETYELEHEIRLLQSLDTGRLSVALGVYVAELSASRVECCRPPPRSSWRWSGRSKSR